MKRKIFLVLAALALFVCAFAISASAVECIDGIYYSLNGTEATVSTDNRNGCQLEEVVIPEKVVFDNKEYTVTSIVTKAFGSGNKDGGNGKIKSLTVPSTITSIGEYAFANCPSLTEVYSKSTKIGSRMFTDCPALKEVKLENTVTIEGNAFNRASIESVIIPSTVTTIGGYAFKQCYSLTKVVILGSIMGEYMFDGCSALNTLVLTENFEVFSKSCLGVAPANGTFTTYYTGKDYDRIKTLGSSTSRFRDAKCYSYSDYTANGYNNRYMLIYDTNLCVAAFNGIHTEPSDDGDCTTPLACSVCVNHTFKNAKEHINIKRVTYSSFMQKGEYYIGCTNDGCRVGTTKVLDALFTCLGYSASTSGNVGITIGFTVNKDAIAEYKDSTGKSLKYGVLAVLKDKLGEGDIFDKGGISDSIFNVEITNYQFTAFEIKIGGFTDAQKDLKIAMGAYVEISDGEATEYSLMQSGSPNEGEKYCFVSYNDVFSSDKEQ